MPNKIRDAQVALSEMRAAVAAAPSGRSLSPCNADGPSLTAAPGQGPGRLPGHATAHTPVLSSSIPSPSSPADQLSSPRQTKPQRTRDIKLDDVLHNYRHGQKQRKHQPVRAAFEQWIMKLGMKQRRFHSLPTSYNCKRMHAPPRIHTQALNSSHPINPVNAKNPSH